MAYSSLPYEFHFRFTPMKLTEILTYCLNAIFSKPLAVSYKLQVAARASGHKTEQLKK